METQSATTYEQTISHLYSVAEQNSTPYDKIRQTPERLVSALWFDRNYRHKDLKTNDGRSLEVLSPGRWNEGPGPDFLDAQILVSGRTKMSGDIEVEVFASNWDKHSHTSNKDFGNVILRVCMWNDIKKTSKSAIPLLELFPFINHEFLPDKLSTKGYPYISTTMKGQCTSMLDARELDNALHFIAAAGEQRILNKANRFKQMALTFGFDQTLYKGFMEALGYSQNKEPMSRLADAVNLDLLRSILRDFPTNQQYEVILSILYGSCGLFEDKNTFGKSSFLLNLHEFWGAINETRKLVIIEGFRLAKIRPANNPFRRLSVMPHLLLKSKGLRIFEHFRTIFQEMQQIGKTSPKDLHKVFSELLMSIEDPFWDNRLSFHTDPGNRKYKLIGQGLCTIIITNILMPAFIAHSQIKSVEKEKDFILDYYRTTNGLPHNALTRFTCARLFGPDELEPGFASNLLIHQGLIQIYHDFCKTLRQDCPDCKFLEYLLIDEAENV